MAGKKRAGEGWDIERKRAKVDIDGLADGMSKLTVLRAKRYPIHSLLKHKNEEGLLKQLVESGCDPDERRKGMTALCHAVFIDAPLSVIQALLNCGADPNLESFGIPPLGLISINPYHTNDPASVARCLISGGASPKWFGTEEDMLRVILQNNEHEDLEKGKLLLDALKETD